LASGVRDTADTFPKNRKAAHRQSPFLRTGSSPSRAHQRPLQTSHSRDLLRCSPSLRCDEFSGCTLHAGNRRTPLLFIRKLGIQYRVARADACWMIGYLSSHQIGINSPPLEMLIGTYIR